MQAPSVFLHKLFKINALQMKNKIIFSIKLIIATFAITFCGCESFFDSVVEIETPLHKPVLVVAAYWETGSDSLAVFVSKSRDVKDNSPFNVKDQSQIGGFNQGNYDTVANAKVELFRNDQLLGEIPNFKIGYHLSKGKYKLDTMSGVRYKIRVSAPNLPTIEAEQVTQGKFTISQTAYKKDAAIYQDPDDPFGREPQKGDEFSFEVSDNSTDENYYTTSTDFRYGNNFNSLEWVFKKPTPSGQKSQFLTSQNIDPLMDAGFLDDKTFNGKNYRWRFFTKNYGLNGIGDPSSGDKMIYKVWSYSKDWYLFVKTRRLLRDSEDNIFFSEPVILYSNIKGGYGIFSIYSKQNVVGILK
jgi:hypothetical protein